MTETLILFLKTLLKTLLSKYFIILYSHSQSPSFMTSFSEHYDFQNVTALFL